MLALLVRHGRTRNLYTQGLREQNMCGLLKVLHSSRVLKCTTYVWGYWHKNSQLTTDSTVEFVAPTSQAHVCVLLPLNSTISYDAIELLLMIINYDARSKTTSPKRSWRDPYFSVKILSSCMSRSWWYHLVSPQSGWTHTSIKMGYYEEMRNCPSPFWRGSFAVVEFHNSSNFSWKPNMHALVSRWTS